MATTRDETWRKAEEAMTLIGPIKVHKKGGELGATEELMDTPEFHAIAEVLDEAGDTLEDAIGAKMCSSSWCGCRSKEIATAVREWLKKRAETI